MDRKQIPPHLYARYGIRVRPLWQRLLGWSLPAAGLLGIGLWIGSSQGSGGDLRLISWQKAGDSVEVRWSVQRYTATDLYCVLESLNAESFTTGYGVMRVRAVPAGNEFISRLRVRGQVYAVAAPVCERDLAHLPAPHFRPGLLAPAQEPPLAAPWQPLPESE